MRRRGDFRRLQAHALRVPTFIAGEPGKIVQKRHRKAEAEAARVQAEIERTRRLFRTKFAPRAAVGLSIYVAVTEGAPPSLEAILKFYIDLTQGTLIFNDRQIEYLDIHAGPPKGGGQAAGTVYLEFERLERLRRLFDFASSHRDATDVERDFTEDPDPDPELEEELEKFLLELGREHVAQWMQLNKSRIYWHERPLSQSSRHDFERELARYRQPFTIELPPVPTPGDGRSLRAEASEAYRRFATRYPRLVPLQLAVDLDIQVWTEGRLKRDLDNILGSLLPSFRELLLGKRGELNGVRIYVNRTTPKSPSPMIRIKVLPFGAIQSWNHRVEEIFEAILSEES